MNNQHQDRASERLKELNIVLRHQLIDTKLVTIQQWNEEIAPKLSQLSMAIDDVVVSAKTYKLPTNYFGE